MAIFNIKEFLCLIFYSKIFPKISYMQILGFSPSFLVYAKRVRRAGLVTLPIALRGRAATTTSRCGTL